MFGPMTGQTMMRSACELVMQLLVLVVVSDLAVGRSLHGSVKRLGTGGGFVRNIRSIRDTRSTHDAAKYMQGTQSNYKMYYEFAETFVSEVSSKLIDDHPDALDNMNVLTKVMSPDDPAFSSSASGGQAVIERLFLFKDLFKHIVDGLGKFVKDDEQGWFSGVKETRSLNDLILSMTLANLRLAMVQYGIKVVPHGVGGINMGEYSTMDPDLLEQITQVAEAVA